MAVYSWCAIILGALFCTVYDEILMEDLILWIGGLVEYNYEYKGCQMAWIVHGMMSALSMQIALRITSWHCMQSNAIFSKNLVHILGISWLNLNNKHKVLWVGGWDESYLYIVYTIHYLQPSLAATQVRALNRPPLQRANCDGEMSSTTTERDTSTAGMLIYVQIYTCMCVCNVYVFMYICKYVRL